MSPHDHRQHNCDIVSDALSIDYAIQPKQPVQEVQKRDQQDALAQHGEHGCREGMSHRLHAVHVHEQDADDRAGQHVAR